MPTNRASIMGIFSSEDQAASAIRGLRNTTYTLERVHSPIPSHKIADALQLPKSMVGWFTLAGGITGFFTGFLFAAFTATRWSLIVSGKPIVALVPFFIVGFEFTILFSVFGNVIGMLTQAKIPRFKLPDTYDPRCSGAHFGILAACSPGEKEHLVDFFKQKGGEVRIFD